MHTASLVRARRRGLLTSAFVVCAVLVFVVASAPAALAFPSTSGGQYTVTCDNAGCHSSGADAPSVTLVSQSVSEATYNVIASGIEWAVFNGATHVAGGNNGGSNTFTMPLGARYTVLDVLGMPGAATSGKTTVVGGLVNYTITPTPARAARYRRRSREYRRATAPRSRSPRTRATTWTP